MNDTSMLPARRFSGLVAAMYESFDIRRLSDLSRQAGRVRNLASTTVVLTCMAMAAPQPAQAGVVGDALTAFAGWVSEMEASISEWIDGAWGDIKVRDRDDVAVEAVATMVIRDPAALNAIAERVGFRLIGFSVSQDSRRVDQVRFAPEREIDREGRLTLWREVLELENTPVRPEMEVARLLLEASDMRENEAPGGFRMTEVAIDLHDSLTAHWRFDTEAAAQ
jgi:hypothetical protein